MTALKWGESRNRTYEQGLDQGVLYPSTGPGVVWNGLISLEEIHAEQEAEDEYLDGVKFKTSLTPADFEAKLTAITVPKEFKPCEGNLELYPGFYAANQPRETFGLSYRTLIGNQASGTEYGYKIHLVYNAIAFAEEVEYETIDKKSNPLIRKWEIKTIPYHKRDYIWFSTEDNYNLSHEHFGFRPVSHVVVSSRSADPQSLSLLEDVLYGTETTDPTLPAPSEVIEIIR